MIKSNYLQLPNKFFAQLKASPAWDLKSFIWFLPAIGSLIFFWKLGNTSFWYDELQTWVTVSIKNPFEFWESYLQRESTPPLFYVLSYVLLLFVKESEISLRIISALSLTACSFVLFRFTSKLVGVLFATAVVALLGSNTFLIAMAQNARAYALFTALALFSLITTLDLIKNGYQKRSYNLLLIFLFASLLTHLYAAVAIFSCISILLIFSEQRVFFAKDILRKFGLIFVLFVLYLLLKKWPTHLSFLSDFDLEEFNRVYDYVFPLSLRRLLFRLAFVFFVVRLLLRRPHKLDRSIFILYTYNLLVLGALFVSSFFLKLYAYRYIQFLIPSQLLLFALLAFSASESLFFFAKDHKLKTFATYTTFSLMIVIFVAAQWVRHFYTLDYYETGHEYPLRQAIEQTLASDKNIQPPGTILNIFIEEYSPDSVVKYLDQYSIEDFGNTAPHKSFSERTEDFKAALKKHNLKIAYYLKIYDPGVNEEDRQIDLPEWERTRIFKKDRISVYRYILKN